MRIALRSIIATIALVLASATSAFATNVGNGGGGLALGPQCGSPTTPIASSSDVTGCSIVYTRANVASLTYAAVAYPPLVVPATLLDAAFNFVIVNPPATTTSFGLQAITATGTVVSGDTSVVAVSITQVTSVTGGGSIPPLAIASSSFAFASPTAPVQTTAISGGNGGPYTCSVSSSSVASCSVNGSTLSVSPSAAGSATVTVSDGTRTSTLSVTVAAASVAAIVLSPTSMAFASPTAASQTATATGGSGTISVSSSASSVATASIAGGTITVNPVAAGSATITATDGTRQATISVTVATAATPGSITASPNSLTFASATAASQTTTLAGGSGPPYTVSSANAQIATASISGSTVTVAAVSVGSTTVTATDGTRSVVVSVTVNANPALAASPATLTFVGSNAAAQQLALSGGNGSYIVTVSPASGVVSLGANGASVPVTPTGYGQAIITVNDTAGDAPVTIPVAVNYPPVTASPSSTSFAHANSAPQTVNLAGGNGGPYSCSSSNTALVTCPTNATGNTIVLTPVAGNFAGGSTTVTIADSTGANAVTFNVTVGSSPAITIAPTSLAFAAPTALGSQFNISGGTAPFTFTVTNGVVAGSLTGNVLGVTPQSPGTDSLTVTGSAGQSATVTATVAATPTPAPGIAIVANTLNGAPNGIIPNLTNTVTGAHWRAFVSTSEHDQDTADQSGTNPISDYTVVNGTGGSTAAAVYTTSVRNSVAVGWTDGAPRGSLTSGLANGVVNGNQQGDGFTWTVALDGTAQQVDVVTLAGCTQNATLSVTGPSGTTVNNAQTTQTFSNLFTDYQVNFAATGSASTATFTLLTGPVAIVYGCPAAGTKTFIGVEGETLRPTGSATPVPLPTPTPIPATPVTLNGSTSALTLNYASPGSPAQAATIGGGTAPYTCTAVGNAATVATCSVNNTTVTVGLVNNNPGGTVAFTVADSANPTNTSTINVVVKAAVSITTPASGKMTFNLPSPATQNATIAGGSGTYTCSTGNSAIATCSVSGTTVTVTAGTTAGSVTLAIGDGTTSANLYVTVNAAVTYTTPNIVQHGASTTGATNTPTFTLQNAPSVGDTLVALVGYNGDGGNRTLATPSGWTLVGASSATGSDVTALLTHTVGSSEPASYVFTLSDASAANAGVLAWEVGHTAGIDVTGIVGGSGTTQTFSTLTPTGTNEIAIAGIFSTNGTNTSFTPSAISSGWSQSGTTGTSTTEGFAFDHPAALASGAQHLSFTSSPNGTSAYSTQTVYLLPIATQTSNVNFTTVATYPSDSTAQMYGINVRKNNATSGDTAFIEQSLLTLGVRNIKGFDTTYGTNTSDSSVAFQIWAAQHNMSNFVQINKCDSDSTITNYVNTFGPGTAANVILWGPPNEPDEDADSTYNCPNLGSGNYTSWQDWFQRRYPQVAADIRAASSLALVDGPSLVKTASYIASGVTPQSGDSVTGTGLTNIAQNADYIDNHDYGGYTMGFSTANQHASCPASGLPNAFPCLDQYQSTNCTGVAPVNQHPLASGCVLISGETGPSYYSLDSTKYSYDVNVGAMEGPRAVLDHQLQGYSLMYRYQLCDANGGGWGLSKGGCTDSTGSGSGENYGVGEVLRPEFYAMKNFLAYYSDPGPAFTPQPCKFNIIGASSALSQVYWHCTQRRSGLFQLAVWIDKQDETITVPSGTTATTPMAVGPLITVPTQSYKLTLPATCSPTSPAIVTFDTSNGWQNPLVRTTTSYVNNADGTFTYTGTASQIASMNEFGCAGAATPT